MQRPGLKKTIACDSDGSAVVEATFVFPFMFMVFFALVMLALYLPQRAMLQRATQHAATAIATELSDAWVYFDEETPRRYVNGESQPSHDALSYGKGQVYAALYGSIFGDTRQEAQAAVDNLDAAENIPVIATGDIVVEVIPKNYIVYREITVKATRSIRVPVDFSVIRFPQTIDLTVWSTAVSNNGDEFIRNIDLAKVFAVWATEKLDIEGVFEKIGSIGNTIGAFLGL